MGRKKLYKNRLMELVKEEEREKDGFPVHYFDGLDEDEKPNEQSIERFVYHATDVFYKKFEVYRIRGYSIDNDKLIFRCMEHQGAERFFYQRELALIPDNLVHRKHKENNDI